MPFCGGDADEDEGCIEGKVKRNSRCWHAVNRCLPLFTTEEGENFKYENTDYRKGGEDKQETESIEKQQKILNQEEDKLCRRIVS